MQRKQILGYLDDSPNSNVRTVLVRWERDIAAV